MADTWEQFHGAVRILVGQGSVKQRLIDAYRRHLASLYATDVPDTIAADFAALHTTLHNAHAAGGLSAPEVAVRKMSDKDAADQAARILDMYASLSELRERERVQAPRLRVVGERLDNGDDDDDGAPAFLSRA
jgi:hypothetical protein